MSARERVRLLESLTTSPLCDEIGAPDIDFQAVQVLRFMAKGSLCLVNFQELDSDGFAGTESWTHFHALSWSCRRFRPVSYLEIGDDPGASMAMVALNSPETHLVSCVSGGEKSLDRRDFQLADFMRELTRSGSNQPLTLVLSQSLASEARYFGDWALRSRGSGQPDIKEFDLIFLDGSRGQASVYRDLKNAFGRCASGGMLIFRGMNRPRAPLPGQHCPRLSGYWERLPLRFPGFRYLKVPRPKEIGLAFRVA